MSPMSKEEKAQMKKMKEFQTLFGYSFKKLPLLKRALTHKSFVNEKKLSQEDHNERLEFLGDAVLELSISQFLMERYPNFSEGELSKLRAAIVNEKQLADLARQFQVGQHLYLGRGEEQTSGREKNSLLADAYEALLGAVYLDRGFKKAMDVIHKHYSELLRDKAPSHFHQDFKTELQEKSQELYRAIPRYRLAAEIGPDHDKMFEIEIFIRNDLLGRGSGRSKKEAEQEAAKRALEKITSGQY